MGGERTEQGARRARYRAAHEAILVAAADVLAEKPWATMQEIARRSGAHRSTVYRHFPRREDLIVALYRRYLDAAAAAMEGHAAPGALDRERFAEATRALASLTLTWRPHSYAPLYTPGLDDQLARLRAATGAVIAAARRTPGLIRADVSAEMARRLWTAPLIYASDPSSDCELVSTLMLASALA